jgi:hypothetical protein
MIQFLARAVWDLGSLVAARPLRRQAAEFEAATRRPREVQEALLRRILLRQADTAFGRDHHFRAIRDAADFRRRLPAASYEDLEPYLARVRRGEFDALLADRQVLMFALTSGTTAARKYIPVTPQYLADYRRGWHLWGLRVYDDRPSLKMRPILQFAGDWDEFRTEGGTPCGAVTGLTARMQKHLIRLLYRVPACAGKVRDPAAKYYLALRLSLPSRLGMIVAANPSTLVGLARAGDREKESLVRDLYDGALSPRCDVPAEVRAALARRLRRRHRARARELEAVVRRTGTLYPRDYWPTDCLLANWTGGSVGAYLRQYPRYFGGMPVRDVGLVASEGRMTIPLAEGEPSGVLDITSHYFEFVPEAEADRPDPVTLGAHELEEGGRYFLLPTTAYGLYRYRLNDLVRVTGFHRRTPKLEFLSKGAHFANLTGEKLSEYQVVRAVEEALRELDLPPAAYALAPCWDEETPYYGLFIEQGDLADASRRARLAGLVDGGLRLLNTEYAAKREGLRLGPLRLELLPGGAWQRWDGRRLARQGGSPEQYKRPCLIPDLNFRDSIV